MDTNEHQIMNPRIKQELAHPDQVKSEMNVGQNERLASVVGGGALTLLGLSRRSPFGMMLAAVGGYLAYRGATGRCSVYEALGIDNNIDEPYKRAIKIEKSVTINKSPEELYQFWRNFENLPRFMKHLSAVEVIDDKRSHWAVKAPAGMQVEWDAEIINEVPNELIAWQSLENANVYNSGSVHFTPAPGGRGTEVKVVIRYDPPAGALGMAIAKLFGEEPAIQVDDDLMRFKQLMEVGEVPSIEGQPTGLGRVVNEPSTMSSYATKKRTSSTVAR